MKKLMFVLMMLYCLCFFDNVDAAQYQGYIFKVKNNVLTLMSENDKVSVLGDNLFCAESINDIYEAVEKENISTIFPDYELELFDVTYPQITSDTEFQNQWYLSAVNSEYARLKGISGNGVKIAVIDSGINLQHSDFNEDNILPGHNCVVGAEDTSDCSDKVGHGTQVAGIVAAKSDNETGICSIAGEAKIIPIKITESSTLNLSSLFLGIEKAIDSDCDIINMSLGGALSDDEALKEMKTLIDKAVAEGIIVIAAVGNSGTTTINYPAGFDNVIGVGSVDSDGRVSYFSQINQSVFVTAPGNDIVTLSMNGSVTTTAGTSLSAPIVTGAAALVKQIRPECTPEEFKKILAETSSDYGLEGYDISYGHGVLNISAILESLSDCIPKFMVSQGMINQTKRIHLHNNYEKEKETNIIFSEYMNNIFDRADIIPGFKLSPGVTNVVLSRDYEKLFLWDKNLTPYTELYDIE